MSAAPLLQDPPAQQVRVGTQGLAGELAVPSGAIGVVVFAHGSGSSRLSPRNQQVARVLHGHRLATLLFDLLDETESTARANVFDIALLGARMVDALDWVARRGRLERLPVGLFGASTGAAAALVAASQRPWQVGAVVSRGGRPDLAGDALPLVTAPTLLIVGALDREVLALNRRAMLALACEKRLEVVPGATHLFEEPGTLDTAAHLAGSWFATRLAHGERH